MIQEGQSQQRRKFYRSIQYRSVSIDINPQKLDIINNQRLPVFSSSKPRTSKAEYRSSKKNLFSSVQQIKSFNKTQSQSLNKTKQINLNSTVISSGSPEQESATNFGNCSYLESFSELMKTQSKKTNETKKMRAVSLRLSGLKPADFLPDRVTLPNIIEYDNSQFTALDPINLPINAIKDHIKRTTKQMQQCPNHIQSIKWEIQDYKTKSISNIQNFKVQFMKGVDKLWGMLRQNTVHQQTFSLRVKRQIKELQNFVPMFNKEFEKSHQDQIELQTTIFYTSPFELKKNENADDGSIIKSKSLLKVQNNYF